jgi:gluconolactonase
LKEGVYRVDAKTGRVDLLTDEIDKPNGICFSADYKKLYVVDTGEARNILVYDIDGTKIRNKKQFTDMKVGGQKAGPDGIRADVDGNIWAGASGGRGVDGVHILNPAGKLIGQIRLPEICANLCFGGTKRNRLFMVGSQSLYSLYVGTQGAHIS